MLIGTGNLNSNDHLSVTGGMTIALGVHVTSGMTIQSLGLKITGAVTVHDGGIMTPR